MSQTQGLQYRPRTIASSLAQQRRAKMSRLPYFPMYPSDFEAKTSHLTLAEDGAYNRLLRLTWLQPTRCLPDDVSWIMRLIRVDQATYDDVILAVLAEFFVLDGGRYTSPTIDLFTDRHRKKLPRPAIPLDLQRYVFSRDGDECVYCGCKDGPFELDHITPWSRGGDHEADNLLVSCRSCNRKKGDRTPIEMGWAWRRREWAGHPNWKTE